MKKCVFLLLIALQAVPSRTQPVTELSADEHRRLLDGEMVIKTIDVPNTAWPMITCYQVISATPEECAAVFSYYPDQIQYSHNLLSALPIKSITPLCTQVEFIMKVTWPVKNSITETKNCLRSLENGGFEVEWSLIEGNSVTESTGSAQFIPCRDETLHRYHTFIRPKSELAGLFEQKMIKDIKRSSRAFKLYTENLRSTRSERLCFYIDQMQAALSGIYIFTATAEEAQKTAIRKKD